MKKSLLICLLLSFAHMHTIAIEKTTAPQPKVAISKKIDPQIAEINKTVTDLKTILSNKLPELQQILTKITIPQMATWITRLKADANKIILNIETFIQDLKKDKTAEILLDKIKLFIDQIINLITAIEANDKIEIDNTINQLRVQLGAPLSVLESIIPVLKQKAKDVITSIKQQAPKAMPMLPLTEKNKNMLKKIIANADELAEKLLNIISVIVQYAKKENLEFKQFLDHEKSLGIPKNFPIVPISKK